MAIMVTGGDYVAGLLWWRLCGGYCGVDSVAVIVVSDYVAGIVVAILWRLSWCRFC